MLQCKRGILHFKHKKKKFQQSHEVLAISYAGKKSDMALLLSPLLPISSTHQLLQLFLPAYVKI